MVREGRVELHRPRSSKAYERGFNDTFWKLLSDCISREPPTRPRFKTILFCLDSLRKVEPPTQSVDPGNILVATTLPSLIFSDPMLGADDKNLTDWRFDTEPSISTLPTTTSCTAPPTRKSESSLGEQSGISYITHNAEPYPWQYPMHVEVTRKCFSATFAVSEGQLGVYLGDTTTSPWQKVTSNKRSLLSCVIGTVLASHPFADGPSVRTETNFGIAATMAEERTHGN